MSGLGQRFAFPPLVGGTAGSFGSIPSGASSPSQGVGDKFGQIALNVKDFGAKGDGSTDDTTAIQACLNAAFGTSGSPHGGTAPGPQSNSAVFFPAGSYNISSALTLRSVRGGHIFGAGRVTTTITNTAANGSVFTTNGMDYSVIERLYLVTNGTGNCFNLNWDNTGTSALQSNTFRDILFEGGARGLSIGEDGFMGSETLIQNCYFINHTVAGLHVRNGNALGQSVIGGNFAQCEIGIWVAAGSCPAIIGTAFQSSGNTFDIEIDNSNTPDTYLIAGTRTESDNFLFMSNGASGVLSGCTQNCATDGVFVTLGGTDGWPGSGSLSVDNCNSRHGIFTGNGTLYIRGNRVKYRPWAITNIVDDGAGHMRITIADTSGMVNGETHYFSGIVGTGAVSALNGTTNVVTVINGTTIDLDSVAFGGTYTSGGVVDGATFGNPAYLTSFVGLVGQNI